MERPIIVSKSCEAFFDEETSNNILRNGTTPYTKESIHSNFDELTHSVENGYHSYNSLKKSTFRVTVVNCNRLAIPKGFTEQSGKPLNKIPVSVVL